MTYPYVCVSQSTFAIACKGYDSGQTSLKPITSPGMCAMYVLQTPQAAVCLSVELGLLISCKGHRKTKIDTPFLACSRVVSLFPCPPRPVTNYVSHRIANLSHARLGYVCSPHLLAYATAAGSFLSTPSFPRFS